MPFTAPRSIVIAMWQRWLLVSAFVMGVANTISRERVFAPLRKRLGGKDTWIGYLVSCPYCLSYWIAFAAVPVFGLRLLTVPHAWGFAAAILEWFANSVLVVTLAAFIRMAFYSIDDLVGVFRRFEKIEEVEIQRLQKSEGGDQPESHQDSH